MRMILVAVVALLVLGGGAAGAYLHFAKSAEASAGHEEEGLHAKEEKGAHKEREKTGHEEFVELDPLMLPIVDDQGVNQVVSMVIALEVGDSKAAEKVKKMTPKLKDAYIQDMYGVLNKHAALKGGVIRVNAIKKRLNKVSQDVLGEDVVHDVLLQVVQQRPI